MATSASARAFSAPARPSRLASLDGVRGLLMVFMALDHTHWFLGAPPHPYETWERALPAYAGTLAFFTRFISHFCAPGFFFLMGTSMVLLAASRSRAGWTPSQTTAFFVKRGLVFILLQFAIENPLWSLAFHSRLADMLGYFGVLFGLGICMLGTAFCLRFSTRSLLAFSVFGMAASETYVTLCAQAPVAPALWLRFLFLPGSAAPLTLYYPLFPWIFVCFLGVIFGRALLVDRDRAFASLGKVAGVSLLAFVACRFLTSLGNFHPVPLAADVMAYFTLVKYPPSFLFLALTLGANALLMVWWNRKAWTGALARSLETLGQAPFFFYLGHLAIYSLFGMFVAAPGLSLPLQYPFWFAGVLILLPLTRRFGAFKQTTPPSSLWRLL